MAFVPPQTADDIEAVREIALLASYADAQTRLAALEQVQWAATRLDIAEWAKNKNKHTIIEGDGVKIDRERNRQDIRNRVRVRFGLPEVDALGQSGSGDCGFFSFTGSVKKNVGW